MRITQRSRGDSHPRAGSTSVHFVRLTWLDGVLTIKKATLLELPSLENLGLVFYLSLNPFPKRAVPGRLSPCSVLATGDIKYPHGSADQRAVMPAVTFLYCKLVCFIFELCCSLINDNSIYLFTKDAAHYTPI